MLNLLDRITYMRNLASSKFDAFLSVLRNMIYENNSKEDERKFLPAEYLQNRINLLEMHADLMRECAITGTSRYSFSNFLDNLVKEQREHDKWIRQNYFLFLKDNSVNLMQDYEEHYARFQESLKSIFPNWHKVG